MNVVTQKSVTGRHTRFDTVELSLEDLAGPDYVQAVCEGRSRFTGERVEDLLAVARRKVDLFPESMQAELTRLLPQVGREFSPALIRSAAGASTRRFNDATVVQHAPLSGYGYYRLGEDGRLYFIAKSEHYHAPLGHSFPGYALVSAARALGVPNATHNNTRGHLTRGLEEALILAANGAEPGQLPDLLAREEPGVLNRVLNLETGSLACEAALKMMLSRFYASQEDAPAPEHQGRIPVFVVMGDDDGSLKGNYHGTTILTQAMRGMWPDFFAALEKAGLFKVRSIRPNSFEDLEAVFAEYDRPPHKIAGFFHEIVMMNYGGRLLSETFLQRAYALCREHEAPAFADEIQSCLWSPEFFMFREIGLRPDFVALGKGFPGGEYPASRILFSARYDVLPLFGALVTNGQEELAALAYRVTMAWAKANREMTAAVGDYYMERLHDLAARRRDRITAVEGRRHLASLYFEDLPSAKTFVQRLNEMGFDISVQAYKASCPPGALTKLPLIAGFEAVDYVVGRMDEALAS